MNINHLVFQINGKTCNKLFKILVVFLLQIPLFTNNISAQCSDTSATGDCDGDSILNGVDLDDDNDGILDVNEGYLLSSCIEKGYLMQGSPATLYTIDIKSGLYTEVGSLSFRYNGIGYNPLDGNLYGVNNKTKELTVVNPNNLNIVRVGPIVPLSSTNAGDINLDDHTYLISSKEIAESSIVYDANPFSPTYLEVKTSYAAQPVDMQDLVYHSATKSFYGIENSSENLYSLDASTGNWTNIATLEGIEKGKYGACYADQDILYFSHNNSGIIYNIDLSTPDFPNNVTAELTSYGPSTKQNDGAKCTFIDIDGLHKDTDPDGDGIPNYFDADSDGDGCPDVVEAGHLESDTRPGEVAGTGYASDGRVSGFATAYSGTNNNVVTVGTLAAITSQPSDKSVYIGDSTVFSVVSDGSVFQWQESTDQGVTFSDINDVGQFTGTDTDSLLIINIIATQSNNRYRVVASKNDYNCGVVSSMAVLTVNNNPPVANGDTGTTTEDATLIVSAANGLLANDSDIDSDDLTVTEFTVAGTTVTAGGTASFTEGVLTVSTDGSYSFAPANDFNGNVPQVGYTISDGTTTAASTLDISVSPANDAPVAIADTGVAVQNTKVVIMSIGLNDSDPDGDIDLSSIVLIDPNNPNNTGDLRSPLELDGIGRFETDASGNVTFTPREDFTGNAVALYTVRDNEGALSIPASITIRVQPDNDGDMIGDLEDLDDDNDGLPDIVELDMAMVRDTDGDGVPDHLDLDSDGDGIYDIVESGHSALDENGDGVIDGADTGSGLNGLFDGIEKWPDSGKIDYVPQDTDGDGTANFRDTDDDGDGIETSDEDLDGNGTPLGDDLDGDGIPDYLDNDDDNDGVATRDELNADCDFDGRPDYLDTTPCGLVPEGFSPNGDGINDLFVIPLLSNYPDFKLEIYNRWGSLVHEYDNNNNANPDWWDGRSTVKLTLDKSGPVPTGTYYYIIYFNDGTRKPNTGWVYLKR